MQATTQSTVKQWTVLLPVLLLAVLVVAGLQLWTNAVRGSDQQTVKSEPARVEPIEGSEFKRVIVTEKAAQRLAIQTAQVREEQVDGTLRKIVPYGSVLYGVHGETWVYTSPEPLVFVRQPITIEYIEDDRAVLSDGPETGTAVVTVGAAELFGVETGVSK